jgi:hypothetical protein
MKIPGQWKSQPKKVKGDDDKKKLYRELFNFGILEGESLKDASARFTAKTGKAVDQDFIDTVQSLEENDRTQKRWFEIMETASSLEEYFHSILNECVIESVRTDNLSLSIFFSSWVNQRVTKAGDKRYQVSLGLAERLAFTELRGLYARDIRLPFPAVLIELPASMAFGIPSLKIPKALLLQEEVPGGAAQKAGIQRVWNLSLMPANIVGAIKEDDRTILARIFLWDDLKWEACVERSLEEIYCLSPLVTPEVQASMFSGDKDVQRKLANLAANLVLYSTNHNARAVPTNKEFIELGERIQKAPPGAKKERLKERRRSLDPDYTIVLGAGVKPIPHDVMDGNKIGVRTLVAGFWRNQVFGPAKTLNEEGEKVWIPAEKREHQMKWIAPFWRGLELGEESPVTNPIRVMKEVSPSIA